LQPLVVDLDGTLIFTDMLHEGALKVLRDSVGAALRIPFWLWEGRAVLKRQVASHTEVLPDSLPYNSELIGWLRSEKTAGRKLVLCTSADSTIAAPIAEHLALFDEVIASDGSHNLSGDAKARALEERFEHAGFDYAGNSRADLHVWRRARRAVVVNASPSLVRQVAQCCAIERVFPTATPGLATWGRVFRLHQWLKNLLLFVPMLAAHHLGTLATWGSLILAFWSFSLCASSVYIANDLLDLDSDRLHPRKRHRPFASGSLPIWVGVVLAPLLLVFSLAAAQAVNSGFLRCVLVYFVLTSLYSWRLKRLLLIDCLTLAVLYTLRIIAGATAAGLGLSFWLLGFSVFLFLSLAFVKRYAELEVQIHNGSGKAHGRGYYTSDAALVQTIGIASGYAASLVLALYINSDAVVKLYKTPEMVWGAVPVALFWVNWMWMKAHRGEMHDDPLIFAIKDPASWMAGVVFGAVLAMGAAGWPW
jgi:4-hydroxybenzoate polyprenyltransferase